MGLWFLPVSTVKKNIRNIITVIFISWIFRLQNIQLMWLVYIYCSLNLALTVSLMLMSAFRCEAHMGTYQQQTGLSCR